MASIVIIKRNGADGPRFPLYRKECLFGRDTVCDLRVQLPGVAMEHAKVVQSQKNSQFFLENLSDNETKINGKLLKGRIGLSNKDVFSIAERSFRFEFNRITGTPRSKSKVPSLRKMSQTPKMVSQTPKVASQSPAMGRQGFQGSPVDEVNHLHIKDSPRTPCPKRASLRESLGKLRRASVPFQEVDENIPNSPDNFEPKENHQVYVVHAVPVASPNNLASVNTPRSAKKITKRVSFGPMLSPEQFDKELPVITPVKKGGIPRTSPAPLSKSCINPGRQRYSVATSSFVSKIEEEKENDSDEKKIKSVEENDSGSGEEFGAGSKGAAPTLKRSLASERKKLATPLREEIERGKKLRECHQKMATPLKNAIKRGFRLKATKKKLQTPLKSEIEAGMKLRQTKKKLATPIRKAIENKPNLRATRQRMPTPVRKAIEDKPSLKETKKMMSKDLQKDIINGITLRKTKKFMPVGLQEEIKAGRTLRTIKRRMKPDLQKETTEGKELKKTRKKMATPIRQEIAEGVQFRMTKRRMPTMLQDEIKSGVIQLVKTKKSMATPLRKDIERGMQLRNARTKDQSKEEPISSRTPKRRFSGVDDGEKSWQPAPKHLKTPAKTPRPTGFFPSTKSRTRSVGRRKSTRLPSYAEILKRPKLTGKRRLSSKQKNVYQLQAEQQGTDVTEVKWLTKTATATTAKEPKLNAKTPNRRKSQAKSQKIKVNKPKDEWEVVVNKRKIKRIKRQRAAKSQQTSDDNFDGVDLLFKTPKAVCAVRKKGQTPKVVKTGEDVSPSGRKISLGLTGIKRLMKTPRRSAEVCLDGLSNLMKTPNEKGSEKASETPSYEGLKRMFSTPKERCSRSDKHPSDSTLYGVSRLMKSPKIRENAEENYEGVPELFEVLEMSSPIKVTRTPSLRRCSTAVEEVKVVSPLEAKPTPSLKKAAETVTVMSPLVEAKTPSLRITAAETLVEWPEQETAYGDSEVAVIKRSTEATSVVTFGGRVTRSKRKLEVNTLPVAKKPCRNRDPRSSSEKRTGEKTEPPTRQSSVLPGAQVGVGDEDMVETFLSRPTTRARRHRNVAEQKNEIEVKSRGKRAAPSEFTEPNVKIQKVMKQFVTMEKSRSRHGDLDNSTQPKQSDVVGAWNKRSTRSSRTNPTNTTPKEGTKLSKSANKAVPSTPKTTSCGSRMSKNVAGIPETPQPLVITKTKLEPITEVPTPASSSRESTVTPSLQFARVELRSRDKRSQESSKIAHTTLKQDITIQATENQRTMRGKRQICSVVQQSVKETKTTIRQRKNVRVDESTNGKQVERITVTAVSSRTRGKLNNEAKNEEQESDHVCNKRSTRRTKITASVEEANVDESSSKRPGGRLTRVSKNDKITNEKTVEEKADGSGQKRLTRARKVSVQLVQEQSSGASCEGKRTSRSRRGTKPVEREEDVKEKENIPDLKKRPRRGDVLSKDENRKSKNDSKSSGESKRTTRSAVKEKLGKKEATSETMNSRTSEGEEKVLVSPAGRVTRSRHSTKKT